MDPGTMMMLASIAAPMVMNGFGGMGGQDEKYGSTYSPNAKQSLDEILNSIRQMGGSPDVTQNQNYQTGQDWLQSMFNDPEFFKSFEAPLQRQFQEETVPGLANRFASMGSGGALGSTAFRNQLAREGSNLSTNLGALRGGMQQQAIPQLAGYAQQPFNNIMQMYGIGTQPTENTYQGPTPGLFGNILGGLSSGAAQGFGQRWGQGMAGQGFPGQNQSTFPQFGGPGG